MDVVGTILGIIDILSGILFFVLDVPGPESLEVILAWFLIIKGISTLFMIPIWFGPMFRIAGWVDTISGSLLFFTFESTLIQAHGIVLLVKGLTTIPSDFLVLGSLFVGIWRKVEMRIRS